MRMNLVRSRIVGLALAGGLAVVPVAAFAEVTTYTVTLSGAAEVPPVETAGSGTAEVTYDTDTKALTWSVSYEGLTGDATAAHFHGPANPGENAGVVVPIELGAMPVTGSATLTDEQAEQFTAGLWYINIHTEANPGGEIRGWVAAE